MFCQLEVKRRGGLYSEKFTPVAKPVAQGYDSTTAAGLNIVHALLQCGILADLAVCTLAVNIRTCETSL